MMTAAKTNSYTQDTHFFRITLSSENRIRPPKISPLQPLKRHGRQLRLIVLNSSRERVYKKVQSSDTNHGTASRKPRAGGAHDE